MFSDQPPPLGSSNQSSCGSDSQQHHERSLIRVLLVEDSRLVRHALRGIVDGHDHLDVVGEASNGLEAIDAVMQLRPDVVVMDLNMPRMNGIDATRCIKEAYPDTSVIGLSVEQDLDTVQRMQAAGIHSYLTKDSAFDTLCRAIEDAAFEKQ